jgi:hypothetical protein
MSENANGVGDSANAVGDQSGEQSKEQKATNPDLERALKDLHKFKSQARELADKAQALEQEKLMAEGKKDELISQLQKQLNETKTKTSELQKTFAWDKVNGWLKTKAATSGIIAEGGAVDKFVSLIDLKGRNPFRDDSTFQLEESVLSQVFEEHKKEMPYFFGKPSPSVKDITPNGGTIETNGSDYSKMSLEQLKAHATKLSQRN